jgi:hypothetical protein
MYRYTVLRTMRTGNDSFDEPDDDLLSSLTLNLVLAGGAGALGLLGWLLTL